MASNLQTFPWLGMTSPSPAVPTEPPGPQEPRDPPGRQSPRRWIPFQLVRQCAAHRVSGDDDAIPMGSRLRRIESGDESKLEAPGGNTNGIYIYLYTIYFFFRGLSSDFQGLLALSTQVVHCRDSSSLAPRLQRARGWHRSATCLRSVPVVCLWYEWL